MNHYIYCHWWKAMHNLCLGIKHKGITITGSDDVIFEPFQNSFSRKKKLMPEVFRRGFLKKLPNAIRTLVILGMPR